MQLLQLMGVCKILVQANMSEIQLPALVSHLTKLGNAGFGLSFSTRQALFCRQADDAFASLANAKGKVDAMKIVTGLVSAFSVWATPNADMSDLNLSVCDIWAARAAEISRDSKTGKLGREEAAEALSKAAEDRAVGQRHSGIEPESRFRFYGIAPSI